MTIETAILWGQQSIWAVLTICGPPLLAALVVGLFISILQAVTQINEMTLVFVPKITAVFLVILLMGSGCSSRLSPSVARASPPSPTSRIDSEHSLLVTMGLVASRVGGVFMIMPAFGARGVPKMTRILCILMLTSIIAPMVPQATVTPTVAFCCSPSPPRSSSV